MANRPIVFQRMRTVECWTVIEKTKIRNSRFTVKTCFLSEEYHDVCRYYRFWHFNFSLSADVSLRWGFLGSHLAITCLSIKSICKGSCAAVGHLFEITGLHILAADNAVIYLIRISQGNDRVHSLFSRDADGALNGGIIFHGGNGKPDQAGAEPHGMRGEQNILRC